VVTVERTTHSMIETAAQKISDISICRVPVFALPEPASLEWTWRHFHEPIKWSNHNSLFRAIHL